MSLTGRGPTHIAYAPLICSSEPSKLASGTVALSRVIPLLTYVFSVQQDGKIQCDLFNLLKVYPASRMEAKNQKDGTRASPASLLTVHFLYRHRAVSIPARTLCKTESPASTGVSATYPGPNCCTHACRESRPVSRAGRSPAFCIYIHIIQNRPPMSE